jgi:dGTPase
MIGTVVGDLIETSRANIDAAGPQSIADVRAADKPLVGLSPSIHEQHMALKRFLSRHLYSHEKKLEMTHQAQAIVRELFELYMADVGNMPDEFADRAAGEDQAIRARVVADYVAGMTDRYAIAEHERLIART